MDFEEIHRIIYNYKRIRKGDGCYFCFEKPDHAVYHDLV